MRAWSSSRLSIPLPPGHHFPFAKYALVREAAVQAGVDRQFARRVADIVTIHVTTVRELLASHG